MTSGGQTGRVSLWPLLCLRSAHPLIQNARGGEGREGEGREGDFSSIFGELPQSFTVASALRAFAQGYIPCMSSLPILP